MSEDVDAEGLTAGRAAALVGVTVRTLHHWDGIRLARPSSHTAAGYRLYTARDMERLRRIVVYRELGLGLEVIRTILDDSDTDIVAMLQDQKARLADRIRRLTALGDDLDRMITAQRQGLLMTAEEQATAFGPAWNPKWPSEARQRYGDTPEWRQYAERSASRTSSDWKAVADAAAAFDRTLAEAMAAGVEPGGSAANALVDRQRETFSEYFPITRRMQVCLGRLYESDPAYAAHYDAVRPGLASWLRRIIDAAARAHGIDPETATWR